MILEQEGLKWFKPAKGQFQIFYRYGADYSEYQPDFVVETDSMMLMIEPKANNQMHDPVVLAKKDAAVKWCAHASDHSRTCDGKQWKYVLMPHNEITTNMTLDVLVSRFGIS